MRKAIVLIGLVASLIITGCTKSEESKKEVDKTIVYCDSCGKESKQVTKFCSNCGEEAKWLVEKPTVEDDDVKEVVKTEKATEEDDKDDIKKEGSNKKEVSKKANQEEAKKLTYCSICNVAKDVYSLNNSEYGLICNECKSEKSEFTYKDAIEIVENHYGIKGHPNDFVTAGIEPYWDDKGIYYIACLKSKEMMEQGGNGILFSVRVYEDGTVVEQFISE